MKADDAKKLKDLERENATLKRLLADPDAGLRQWLRDSPKPILGGVIAAPTTDADRQVAEFEERIGTLRAVQAEFGRAGG